MCAKKSLTGSSRDRRTASNRQNPRTTDGDDNRNDEVDAIVMDDHSVSSRMDTQSTTEGDVSNSNDVTNTPMNSTRAADHDQIDPVPSKSKVWDYAIKLSDQQARCLNCNSIVACKGHSTTGLRRHLRRCLNLSIFASSPSNSRNRSAKEKSISPEVKRKIDMLVYQGIIKDGRSFGDLRKPGMMHLFKQLQPGKHE